MKSMKTIIALLLGATGTAAFTTGAKTAIGGLGSLAFAKYPALPEEIFAPAVKDAPLKQEPAPGRRLADRCEDWCAGHSDPWNERCGWDDKACSGCAQCNSCSDIGCCFGWCAGESAPWNERCGWDTNACSACTDCATACAAPRFVKDNVCVAFWPYKCATNTYVLNNECTACPSGHTCDGAAATKTLKKTAAERADCLADGGSCGKCCEGITGACVTESKYLNTLTDEDDCVLLKGISNKIEGGGGDDAIVVKGDGNHLHGGEGKDALTVVEGVYNYLYGGDGEDALTVVKGDANQLYGEANNDKLTVIEGTYNRLFGGAGEDTFYLPDETTQESITDGKGNATYKSSTPLIVGLCVGAAVLVLGLAVVVRKLRGRAAEETSMPQPDAEVQVEA